MNKQDPEGVHRIDQDLEFYLAGNQSNDRDIVASVTFFYIKKP